MAIFKKISRLLPTETQNSKILSYPRFSPHRLVTFYPYFTIFPCSVIKKSTRYIRVFGLSLRPQFCHFTLFGTIKRFFNKVSQFGHFLTKMPRFLKFWRIFQDLRPG